MPNMNIRWIHRIEKHCNVRNPNQLSRQMTFFHHSTHFARTPRGSNDIIAAYWNTHERSNWHSSQFRSAWPHTNQYLLSLNISNCIFLQINKLRTRTRRIINFIVAYWNTRERWIWHCCQFRSPWSYIGRFLSIFIIVKHLAAPLFVSMNTAWLIYLICIYQTWIYEEYITSKITKKWYTQSNFSEKLYFSRFTKLRTHT